MVERTKVLQVIETVIQNERAKAAGAGDETPTWDEDAGRLARAICEALDAANLEVLEKTEGPRENWPPI
jgi:hypothetical protein